MARTTATAVKRLLASNYDTVNNPSLDGPITLANLLITKVNALAVAESSSFTSAELEMMERYVAAQRYCDSDPMYTSRSTLSASGAFRTFDNDIGEYAKAACSLDTTGNLMALLKGNTAGASWAGKTDSEQLTWDERN